MEVDYAKSNLKTSLSPIWMICQLLPFVRVGQWWSESVSILFTWNRDLLPKYGHADSQCLTLKHTHTQHIRHKKTVRNTCTAYPLKFTTLYMNPEYKFLPKNYFRYYYECLVEYHGIILFLSLTHSPWPGWRHHNAINRPTLREAITVTRHTCWVC